MKILLICIASVFWWVNVCLGNQERDKNFSEIILGDILKTPEVNKINSLVEEAEETVNIDKLKAAEISLKKKIEKGAQPKFLYYYFLARIYFSFTNLYEQTQNKKMICNFLEKALPLCKKAIKDNRKFSDAHRLLSDIYGRLIPFKNPIIYGSLYGERSVKEAELAIKLNPQNPEAYLARGRSYFFTPTGFGGDKKKALEMFQKAAAVCPNYYLSYMWIGMWYRDRGEKDKSKEFFEKVLELKPNFGWARHELTILKSSIGANSK